MTTAAIADLILVSWNVGYGWTSYHVEVDIGLTRCGIRFATERVDRKYVPDLHGVPDVCGTCAKHTPARGPSVDVDTPLNPDSISALLLQAGLTIITASPVGVIAQCAADLRGIRLHRAVLQPHDGVWQGSYAIALPNRRLGQPRIHQVVSRHATIRDALELVLWLLASERAAQKWVG
jgi:hypothetical protein